jgi:hypothetical protein
MIAVVMSEPAGVPIAKFVALCGQLDTNFEIQRTLANQQF